MLRQRIFIILLFLFWSGFIPASHAAVWKTIAPGIRYLDAAKTWLNPWAHVHVFSIDLTLNRLDLILATKLSHQHASAGEFAHYQNALLTINGGFFDHDFHPLGLRVSHHHQYNPLKRISWWGIFYIQDQEPHITSLKHFNSDESVDFAVQSGPRLIIHGRTPSLKAGIAERSAIGITPDNKVIILVTDHAPMTTTHLALLMKAPPLSCQEALNLDGGSSSQLHAHIGAFQIEVHGFSNVSDAIVVYSR